MGKAAGTTNVVWGFMVHDWRAAGWYFDWGSALLFCVKSSWDVFGFDSVSLTALLHAQDSARIAAAIALAVLLGWIYKKFLMT